MSLGWWASVILMSFSSNAHIWKNFPTDFWMCPPSISWSRALPISWSINFLWERFYRQQDLFCDRFSDGRQLENVWGCSDQSSQWNRSSPNEMTISSGETRDIHLRENLLTELEEGVFASFWLFWTISSIRAGWILLSERRSSRDFFAT